MNQSKKDLISVLGAAIGKKYVLTDQESLKFYSMDVYRSIEIPIAMGHTPITKNDGGSQGIKPKRLKTVVGSLSDRSLIHPKKG